MIFYHSSVQVNVRVLSQCHPLRPDQYGRVLGYGRINFQLNHGDTSRLIALFRAVQDDWDFGGGGGGGGSGHRPQCVGEWGVVVPLPGLPMLRR